jgi:hypothetical protein
MNQILPNAVSLVTMTENELREELCRDIYDRANSHEMIRRLVRLAKFYGEMADNARAGRSDCVDTIRVIREAISELKD